MDPADGASTLLTAGFSDSARGEVLTVLDAYYDTAPRAMARAEEHGALVLFVAQRIRAVLARQRELEVPQALEWVHEATPSLIDAAQAAGMTVQQFPLLALESLVDPRPADGEVRLINADDAELGAVNAAIGVAFVHGAGAVGGGSHNPRGEVSEIVGVGVLPAFRRRGLARAVAHLLARQTLDNGVITVFCGAESADVARVYENVGFRRLGTTCTAAID